MKLILLLTALHARIFGGRIDNTVIGGDTRY
ncbi:MAG: hypothetical protein A4E69_01869 [Syntrophus sp. PtaB.Bin138]|nr:MAG: hypothetical protein A4E69_01869 [Syntrophus sp. PtaB.Bin138]